MAEETTERQGNGGVEDAQPKNGAGENIVYLVYVEKYSDSDTLGMAFVACPYSTTGFKLISEHISSSVKWAKEDMTADVHLRKYEREFPDGYTVVEIEEPFFGGFTKSSVTTVEGRKKLDELWDEIYSALAAKRQEHLKEKVYRKYRIVDAMTGKEKKGIYFILKVDAKDETERKCVRAALAAYADSQRAAGRADFADSIEKLIQRG